MKRIITQIRKPLVELLKAKGWIWKVPIAGLCGSVTHTLLMLVKTKLGVLEAFQPYQSLQIALSSWTGEYVHPLMPWLISYVNGSTVAGLAGSKLLYRDATGFEKSLADLDSERITLIKAELIRDVWNPYACPSRLQR